MIRISRWWLALVVLLVLGAVFIDAYGPIYNVVVRHTSATAALPDGKQPTLLGNPIYIHRGLDLQGGTSLTIQICQGDDNPPGVGCTTGLPKGRTLAEAQADTYTILERRVNSLGVSGAQLQTQGNNQILIQLPGVDVATAEAALGQTSELHFATPVAGTPSVNGSPGACSTKTCIDQKQLIPSGCWKGTHLKTTATSKCQFSNSSFYPVNTTTGTQYHWKIVTGLTADDVSSAAVGSVTGGFAVDITFNSQGAAVWSKLTTKACKLNPGCDANSSNGTTTAAPPTSQLAIFLDGQVLTAPAVAGVSSNQTQITGNFTFNSATQLVDDINAGALPAQIAIGQVSGVSASLGKQSVQQSLTAGAFGLLLVILFMLFYYRFPGLLASIALIFYAAIVLAVFKLIPVVLTLPGLAGFILSVGMAVDANVLIFERMKEELRQDRPLELATEYGFRRAWPAIRDSNISTMITCTVLYFFGSTDVKGFALTLFIGVAASMFSSIVITHSLLHYVQRWFSFARRPRLYTRILPTESLAKSFRSGGRFDVVTHRNAYFAASLAIIIPGIFAILIGGFNLGVDFTGGDSLTVHPKQTTSAAAIQKVSLAAYPAGRASVVGEGGNTYVITTLPIVPSKVDAILKAVNDHFDLPKDSSGSPVTESETTVGPTIASSLVVGAVFLVIISAVLISCYLGLRFAGTQIRARRFALCAMGALLHDIFVLVGLWAILGHFSLLGQVNTLFVTAVLTMVGFSVHDTIVVFDRIRENLRVQGSRMNFDQVVNLSIAQTLSRSLNTSLTVVFVLLTLFLFGGTSIQGFVLALLVGIISGTYSSIFNAATLLTAWRGLDRRVARRSGARVPTGAVTTARH
ncbi:MAG TPA: protein translocase subunit SecD [Candidatus Dormibacteraeota bacterium]|nr:protein translocase subunit SecD [Candidatus Dormibacteraeota bacterium]